MEHFTLISFFGFILVLSNFSAGEVKGEASGDAMLLKSVLFPGFVDEEEFDQQNKSAEDLYVYHDDGDKMDVDADEYDEEDLQALDVSIRAILNCPASVTCPGGELCTMHLNYPNCFLPALACQFLPCKNGGTCVNNRCNCLPGFSGHLCTDTATNNGCYPGFCQNGGRCINSIPPSCACIGYYTGQRCQVAPPTVLPPPPPRPCSLVCANGGTCIPQGNSYRCACVRPYTGKLCQTNVCLGYCNNGGRCSTVGLPPRPTCTCVASYTGQRCGISPARTTQSPGRCAFVVCANGGTCIPQGNLYRCLCLPPYTGRLCRTNLCLGFCYHGGRCSMVGLPPRPTCTCVAPYTGQRCEISQTNFCLGYCYHGGSCTLINSNTPACTCGASYTGQRCEISLPRPTISPRPCDFSACANGGTCVPQGNSYRCSCLPQYTGQLCQTNLCLGYCYHAGRCSMLGLPPRPTCTCIASYTGQRCEIPPATTTQKPNPCAFVVCANGGTCTPQGSWYRCLCLPPYTGQLCQTDPCSGYCYNGGSCSTFGTITPTCACISSYTGQRCEIPPVITTQSPRPCTFAVCANGGTCIPQGNSYRCSCVPPYTGQNCLTLTNPCFGVYCYNGGSCSTPFGTNTPICTCVASYTGPRCQFPPRTTLTTNPCAFVDCANGGTCIPQGGTFRCSCQFPYTGPRCLTSPCTGYCLNGGDCTLLGNGGPSCVCPSTYSGERCSEVLDPCKNAICPQGQNCQAVGSSYRCTRVEPPSAVCQPDPCQGDCRCTPSCKHEGGYVCVTDRGFLGRHCDIPIPEIRCSADEIVVEVSPRFYNEFDADQRNSILFMSPSADGVGRSTTQCQSRLVDGTYRIAVSHPFTQCGTSVGTERGSDGGDMVVFTNEVWLNKNFGQGGGYDMPFPVVRLQCKYNDEYVIYTSLKPTVAPIRGIIFGNIQYDVTPSICKVSTCGEPCPQQFAVQKSAVFTVGQIIHFGFDVTSRSTTNLNEGTATLLHATVSCSASLDDQPLQNQAFDLLKDGCPTEHGTALTAQLGSPASPKHLCMSFRLPRSKVCSEIFIHISLKMCRQTVSATCPNGNTVPACASRKRRSVSSVNAEPITIGPIFLIDRESGQEQVAFLADDAIIDVMPRPNVTETPMLLFSKPLLQKPITEPAVFDITTLSVFTVVAILLACFVIAMVLLFRRLHSSDAKHNDS